MTKTSLFAVALAFAACGSLGSAHGQAEPPKEAPKQDAKQDPKTQEPKKEEPKKEEPKKEEPKRDPKALEYEKAIKDLPKTEGAFTFYQRKRDILLELPESKLGQIFLIQAAVSSGVSSIFLQAGEPIGTNEIDAYRFDRNEDQVWLVRPNFRFRWSDKDMLKIAAERSMPNAILGSFRIEHAHPEKKLLLINFTPVFYGDMFRLTDMVNFVLGGQYGLDREKSSVEAINGYPENTVLRTKMHFYSPRGAEGNPLLEMLGFGGNQLEDSRSVPMKVTYNLWFREDKGYMPRVADPRVGYFTSDFYSLDKFLNQDRTERYITRFNLEKKDSKAELSEPAKPIVWTIDHSVPEQYRESVKAGVLRWNKAFEALGYKDAIQVQDAPNDKNYDHADGRLNVIRWTMSPDAGYAISLFRIDPFTGEVLNASITVDANMLAHIINDYQDSTMAVASASERAQRALLRDANRQISDDSFIWASQKEEAMRELGARLGKFGWRRHACELEEGLAQSAAFGWNAMQLHGTAITKEQYAKEYIEFVVAHEVGHCLGLRHNFLGSTLMTTEQLADDKLTTEQNVSASVMDYLPVNIQAVLKGKGNFFSPKLGAYDIWAIQYGYADRKSDTPLGERHALSMIASRHGQPGLLYQTDENADAWDPYVVRFDNAKDPIAYSARTIEAARRMRQYAISQLPRRGESFNRRTQLVLASVLKTFREGRATARFVGGISSSRNFKGDAVERGTLLPVDVQSQRQAMRLIVQSCFAPTAFAMPESVMTSLSLDPADPETAQWNAPLREILSVNQMMLYASVMSAGTTDRIAENDYKLGNEGYGLDEHFSILLGAVFREVGASNAIPPLRRDLQRFSLHALMLQAGAPHGAVNEDVRTLAADSLRRLDARIKAAMVSPKLDGMTRVHLRDSHETIQRFMARQLQAGR